MMKVLIGFRTSLIIFLVFGGCGGSSEKRPSEEAVPASQPNQISSRGGGDPFKGINDEPSKILASSPPATGGGAAASGPRGSLESLGLRLVRDAADGSDEASPDPSFQLGEPRSLGESTWDATGGVFHRKLFLADPQSPNPEGRRRLFFVWPENPWGSPIRNAVFTHRVVSLQNRRTGDLNPRQAWHDLEHQRWFIPISELFRNDGNWPGVTVSSEDTQVVSLELTLESGASVPVEIRFQAVGPMPAMAHDVRTQVLPSTAEGLVRGVSNQGRMIRRESWVNPSPRSFTLWVRARTPSRALLLSTQIQKSTYQGRSTDSPLGPHQALLISSAELQVNEVVVEHREVSPSGGDVLERKTQVGQGWVSFTVRPLETFVLSWWAKPNEGTRHCTLPQPQPMTYYWQTIPPQTSRRVWVPGARCWHHQVDPPLPPVLHSQEVQNTETIVGGGLIGNWQGEVRITHPFTSVEEATREPGDPAGNPIHYWTLVSGDFNENLRVGTLDRHNSPAYPCQGVFLGN